ncbi:LLM class flavin-dependent oxidoreductase [Paenibacillus methanolicus]|uniref:Luciferase family oxidoreductase group 1 n=1 Tax=Paenibacillus methanolicus TaxID=582686 RepID=A0A5S5C0C0_9BACL|nr:LLM class flavin-dependent oxidoreductase [Paenibacillus methanolicus]TYP71916.1 luciferase family oxidoreductase group 1 [Paenibacillus methanolicus]
MSTFTPKLSVLDLAPILAGGSARDAYRRTLDLARHAEKLGYHRFWLAEHHNMPGIASSATALLIGHVASGTEKIRVGSGGVMLPNHAPLVVAEQFGMLESLFPGRIDLGLGRASGTDMRTTQALRRTMGAGGADFPELLSELRAYLDPTFEPNDSGVRAVPGEGLNIPVWLLGSSDVSARMAGRLGLPFAFASHFAPDGLHGALKAYRSSFIPSRALKEPYVMIGLTVMAADDADEARYLATSEARQVLSLLRGRPDKLQPPVEDMDALWNSREKALISKQLDFGLIGDQATIREKLPAIYEATQADEFIITSHLHDHQARLRSYEIVAETAKEMWP